MIEEKMVGRKRLPEELLQREQQQSLERIFFTQELERRKWALAIHDGIIQSLGNIYYRLQAYRRLLTKNPREAQQDLDTIEELVVEAIAECRGIMDDLRPSVLDDIGLIPAVEKYLNRIKKEDNCQVTFKVKGAIPRLSSETETALYRIIREALLNVRKHAKATKVRVTISSQSNRLAAEIVDNGCGFDMEAVDAEGDNWGLIGMRERAEIVGASLQIKATQGQGTSVHIDVPASS